MSNIIEYSDKQSDYIARTKVNLGNLEADYYASPEATKQTDELSNDIEVLIKSSQVKPEDKITIIEAVAEWFDVDSFPPDSVNKLVNALLVLNPFANGQIMNPAVACLLFRIIDSNTLNVGEKVILSDFETENNDFQSAGGVKGFVNFYKLSKAAERFQQAKDVNVKSNIQTKAIQALSEIPGCEDLKNQVTDILTPEKHAEVALSEEAQKSLQTMNNLISVGKNDENSIIASLLENPQQILKSRAIRLLSPLAKNVAQSATKVKEENGVIYVSGATLKDVNFNTGGKETLITHEYDDLETVEIHQDGKEIVIQFANLLDKSRPRDYYNHENYFSTQANVFILYGFRGTIAINRDEVGDSPIPFKASFRKRENPGQNELAYEFVGFEIPVSEGQYSSGVKMTVGGTDYTDLRSYGYDDEAEQWYFTYMQEGQEEPIKMFLSVDEEGVVSAKLEQLEKSTYPGEVQVKAELEKDSEGVLNEDIIMNKIIEGGDLGTPVEELTELTEATIEENDPTKDERSPIDKFKSEVGKNIYSWVTYNEDSKEFIFGEGKDAISISEDNIDLFDQVDNGFEVAFRGEGGSMKLTFDKTNGVITLSDEGQDSEDENDESQEAKTTVTFYKVENSKEETNKQTFSKLLETEFAKEVKIFAGGIEINGNKFALHKNQKEGEVRLIYVESEESGNGEGNEINMVVINKEGVVVEKHKKIVAQINAYYSNEKEPIFLVLTSNPVNQLTEVTKFSGLTIEEATRIGFQMEDGTFVELPLQNNPYIQPKLNEMFGDDNQCTIGYDQKTKKLYIEIESLNIDNKVNSARKISHEIEIDFNSSSPKFDHIEYKYRQSNAPSEIHSVRIYSKGFEVSFLSSATNDRWYYLSYFPKQGSQGDFSWYLAGKKISTGSHMNIPQESIDDPTLANVMQWFAEQATNYHEVLQRVIDSFGSDAIKTVEGSDGKTYILHNSDMQNELDRSGATKGKYSVRKGQISVDGKKAEVVVITENFDFSSQADGGEIETPTNVGEIPDDKKDDFYKSETYETLLRLNAVDKPIQTEAQKEDGVTVTLSPEVAALASGALPAEYKQKVQEKMGYDYGLSNNAEHAVTFAGQDLVKLTNAVREVILEAEFNAYLGRTQLASQAEPAPLLMAINPRPDKFIDPADLKNDEDVLPSTREKLEQQASTAQTPLLPVGGTARGAQAGAAETHAEPDDQFGTFPNQTEPNDIAEVEKTEVKFSKLIEKISNENRTSFSAKFGDDDAEMSIKEVEARENGEVAVAIELDDENSDILKEEIVSVLTSAAVEGFRDDSEISDIKIVVNSEGISAYEFNLNGEKYTFRSDGEVLKGDDSIGMVFNDDKIFSKVTFLQPNSEDEESAPTVPEVAVPQETPTSNLSLINEAGLLAPKLFEAEQQDALWTKLGEHLNLNDEGKRTPLGQAIYDFVKSKNQGFGLPGDDGVGRLEDWDDKSDLLTLVKQFVEESTEAQLGISLETAANAAYPIEVLAAVSQELKSADNQLSDNDFVEINGQRYISAERLNESSIQAALENDPAKAGKYKAWGGKGTVTVEGDEQEQKEVTVVIITEIPDLGEIQNDDSALNASQILDAALEDQSHAVNEYFESEDFKAILTANAVGSDLENYEQDNKIVHVEVVAIEKGTLPDEIIEKVQAKLNKNYGKGVSDYSFDMPNDGNPAHKFSQENIDVMRDYVREAILEVQLEAYLAPESEEVSNIATPDVEDVQADTTEKKITIAQEDIRKALKQGYTIALKVGNLELQVQDYSEGMYEIDIDSLPPNIIEEIFNHSLDDGATPGNIKVTKLRIETDKDNKISSIEVELSDGKEYKINQIGMRLIPSNKFQIVELPIMSYSLEAYKFEEFRPNNFLEINELLKIKYSLIDRDKYEHYTLLTDSVLQEWIDMGVKYVGYLGAGTYGAAFVLLFDPTTINLDQNDPRKNLLKEVEMRISGVKSKFQVIVAKAYNYIDKTNESIDKPKILVTRGISSSDTSRADTWRIEKMEAYVQENLVPDYMAKAVFPDDKKAIKYQELVEQKIKDIKDYEHDPAVKAALTLGLTNWLMGNFIDMSHINHNIGKLANGAFSAYDVSIGIGDGQLLKDVTDMSQERRIALEILSNLTPESFSHIRAIAEHEFGNFATPPIAITTHHNKVRAKIVQIIYSEELDSKEKESNLLKLLKDLKGSEPIDMTKAEEFYLKARPLSRTKLPEALTKTIENPKDNKVIPGLHPHFVANDSEKVFKHSLTYIQEENNEDSNAADVGGKIIPKPTQDGINDMEIFSEIQGFTAEILNDDEKIIAFLDQYINVDNINNTSSISTMLREKIKTKCSMKYPYTQGFDLPGENGAGNFSEWEEEAQGKIAIMVREIWEEENGMRFEEIDAENEGLRGILGEEGSDSFAEKIQGVPAGLQNALTFYKSREKYYYSPKTEQKSQARIYIEINPVEGSADNSASTIVINNQEILVSSSSIRALNRGGYRIMFETQEERDIHGFKSKQFEAIVDKEGVLTYVEVDNPSQLTQRLKLKEEEGAFKLRDEDGEDAEVKELLPNKLRLKVKGKYSGLASGDEFAAIFILNFGKVKDIYLSNESVIKNPTEVQIHFKENNVKSITVEYFEAFTRREQIITAQDDVKNIILNRFILPSDQFAATGDVEGSSSSEDLLRTQRNEYFKNADINKILANENQGAVKQLLLYIAQVASTFPEYNEMEKGDAKKEYFQENYGDYRDFFQRIFLNNDIPNNVKVIITIVNYYHDLIKIKPNPYENNESGDKREADLNIGLKVFLQSYAEYAFNDEQDKKTVKQVMSKLFKYVKDENYANSNLLLMIFEKAQGGTKLTVSDLVEDKDFTDKYAELIIEGYKSKLASIGEDSTDEQNGTSYLGKLAGIMHFNDFQELFLKYKDTFDIAQSDIDFYKEKASGSKRSVIRELSTQELDTPAITYFITQATGEEQTKLNAILRNRVLENIEDAKQKRIQKEPVVDLTPAYEAQPGRMTREFILDPKKLVISKNEYLSDLRAKIIQLEANNERNVQEEELLMLARLREKVETECRPFATETSSFLADTYTNKNGREIQDHIGSRFVENAKGNVQITGDGVGSNTEAIFTTDSEELKGFYQELFPVLEGIVEKYEKNELPNEQDIENAIKSAIQSAAKSHLKKEQETTLQINMFVNANGKKQIISFNLGDSSTFFVGEDGSVSALNNEHSLRYQYFMDVLVDTYKMSPGEAAHYLLLARNGTIPTILPDGVQNELNAFVKEVSIKDPIVEMRNAFTKTFKVTDNYLNNTGTTLKGIKGALDEVIRLSQLKPPEFLTWQRPGRATLEVLTKYNIHEYIESRLVGIYGEDDNPIPANFSKVLERIRATNKGFNNVATSAVAGNNGIHNSVKGPLIMILDLPEESSTQRLIAVSDGITDNFPRNIFDQIIKSNIQSPLALPKILGGLVYKRIFGSAPLDFSSPEGNTLNDLYNKYNNLIGNKEDDVTCVELYAMWPNDWHSNEAESAATSSEGTNRESDNELIDPQADGVEIPGIEKSQKRIIIESLLSNKRLDLNLPFNIDYFKNHFKNSDEISELGKLIIEELKKASSSFSLFNDSGEFDIDGWSQIQKSIFKVAIQDLLKRHLPNISIDGDSVSIYNSVTGKKETWPSGKFMDTNGNIISQFEIYENEKQHVRVYKATTPDGFEIISWVNEVDWFAMHVATKDIIDFQSLPKLDSSKLWFQRSQLYSSMLSANKFGSNLQDAKAHINGKEVEIPRELVALTGGWLTKDIYQKVKTKLKEEDIPVPTDINSIKNEKDVESIRLIVLETILKEEFIYYTNKHRDRVPISIEPELSHEEISQALINQLFLDEEETLSILPYNDINQTNTYHLSGGKLKLIGKVGEDLVESKHDFVNVDVDVTNKTVSVPIKNLNLSIIKKFVNSNRIDWLIKEDMEIISKLTFKLGKSGFMELSEIDLGGISNGNEQISTIKRSETGAVEITILSGSIFLDSHVYLKSRYTLKDGNLVAIQNDTQILEENVNTIVAHLNDPEKWAYQSDKKRDLIKKFILKPEIGTNNLDKVTYIETLKKLARVIQQSMATEQFMGADELLDLIWLRLRVENSGEARSSSKFYTNNISYDVTIRQFRHILESNENDSFVVTGIDQTIDLSNIDNIGEFYKELRSGINQIVSKYQSNEIDKESLLNKITQHINMSAIRLTHDQKISLQINIFATSPDGEKQVINFNVGVPGVSAIRIGKNYKKLGLEHTNPYLYSVDRLKKEGNYNEQSAHDLLFNYPSSRTWVKTSEVAILDDFHNIDDPIILAKSLVGEVKKEISSLTVSDKKTAEKASRKFETILKSFETNKDSQTVEIGSKFFGSKKYDRRNIGSYFAEYIAQIGKNLQHLQDKFNAFNPYYKPRSSQYKVPYVSSDGIEGFGSLSFTKVDDAIPAAGGYIEIFSGNHGITDSIYLKLLTKMQSAIENNNFTTNITTPLEKIVPAIIHMNELGRDAFPDFIITDKEKNDVIALYTFVRRDIPKKLEQNNVSCMRTLVMWPINWEPK